jgi:hypothetical protein
MLSRISSMFVPDLVISLAIKPIGTETSNFSRALNRFQKGGPTFRVHIDHESKEARLLCHVLFHLELTAQADDHLGHGVCCALCVGCNSCACTVADSRAYFILIRAGQVVAPRSNSLPQTSHKIQSSTVPSLSALSRAGTLPVRLVVDSTPRTHARTTTTRAHLHETTTMTCAHTRDTTSREK